MTKLEVLKELSELMEEQTYLKQLDKDVMMKKGQFDDKVKAFMKNLLGAQENATVSLLDIVQKTLNYE